MGGKSYFCDYCCCFMKNDLNVRKLHNAGVSHCAAKANYLRRFEGKQRKNYKNSCLYGFYFDFQIHIRYW